ncbi:MAG: hypothetical protein K2I30_03280 [Clostridia bacterium]|nr:hypothetical protein [Clostridia bacterium]
MDFLQFIKKFIEGEIPPADFQNEIINNEGLQKFIDFKVKGLPKYLEEYGYSLWVYLACLDAVDVGNAYEMHERVKKIFDDEGFKPTDKYKVAYNLFLDLNFILNYVDCPQITEKLIAELPEVSYAQKKKIMRKKLKELFVCDNKPPEWIQDPEWPLRNGKPMVFKGQYDIKDGCRYVFYDEEGEQEVEQFD